MGKLSMTGNDSKAYQKWSVMTKSQESQSHTMHDINHTNDACIFSKSNDSLTTRVDHFLVINYHYILYLN